MSEGLVEQMPIGGSGPGTREVGGRRPPGCGSCNTAPSNSMTLHLAEAFPNSEHPRTLAACPSPPASLLFDCGFS